MIFRTIFKSFAFSASLQTIPSCAPQPPAPMNWHIVPAWRTHSPSGFAHCSESFGAAKCEPTPFLDDSGDSRSNNRELGDTGELHVNFVETTYQAWIDFLALVQMWPIR